VRTQTLLPPLLLTAAYTSRVTTAAALLPPRTITRMPRHHFRSSPQPALCAAAATALSYKVPMPAPRRANTQLGQAKARTETAGCIVLPCVWD
jgi:hypothetical protein